MKKDDSRRQTVRDALNQKAFDDPIMDGFRESNNFQIGAVLARARALANGKGSERDVGLARDMVLLIEGFTD